VALLAATFVGAAQWTPKPPTRPRRRGRPRAGE
jgi:hypothetical protein